MSQEDFLKRWSRRKREAQRSPDALPAAKPEPPSGTTPGADTPNEPKPAFDLASLPPIESITAASDISAFLRAGVPAELTRAALRRVWTSDPAIRDFVGLAENAWDFNDPNAIPGFGPLDLTEEARGLMARAVRQTGDALQSFTAEKTAEEPNANDSSALTPGNDLSGTSVGVPPLAADESGVRCAEPLPAPNNKDIAAQHDAREASAKQEPLPRRTHGGALPRI